MRKKISGILLLIAFLLGSSDCFASHIFGGELLYTHIADSTYKLTLTLYGDCGAPKEIFDSLYTAAPEIGIFDGTNLLGVINMSIEEAGTEVSPVCMRELKNTKCSGGTLPGVRRFKYSVFINLPYKSKDWRFVFSGSLGGNLGAGRSNNITNIIQPPLSGSIMQLKAKLDNTVPGDNSSPRYSTIPTPYYCINLQGEFNQGAIDEDGDSLSFDLVAATDGNTNNDVNYRSPFSETAPLATATGAFKFNTLNGQMSFIPNVTQDGLVVCKVSEYRKGVLIGTSEREMTFIVLDNCTGTAPTSFLNTVAGGSVAGENVINICVGTPHLSFNVNINNPDGDNTQLATSNVPTGSTVNIINNGSNNPSISFDWATGSIPPGIYTFYVNINNDHCPLANRSTVAYTIKVAPPPVLDYVLVSSTQCLHKAVVKYNISYGFAPRTVTLYTGITDVYKTYTDSTGSFTDSLPVGKYTIVTSSGDQCKTTNTIAISDSGDLPLLPIVRDYCINGPTAQIQQDLISADAVITWYYSNGQVLFYPPIPDTKKAGVQSWYYIEQYRQCISTKIPVTATVHELPVPAIADSSIPSTICIGDTIYLKATGGAFYTWTPADQVIKDSAGNEYIRVVAPVTLQLKVADIYGCADSITHVYKDLQYCCLFSYPNAFTPNKDGKNDGFRIISYGNLTQYNLLVFNRWGQQVFQTNDPREYWDGTFNGIPCDMGTYYYYFKAQCLTGYKEESKGDVILIR